MLDADHAGGFSCANARLDVSSELGALRVGRLVVVSSELANLI